MRTTALLLAIALLVAILEHGVQADFYYNRVLPKADELISKDLKCIPGRTVIRIAEKVKPKNGSDEENDDNDNTRRSHMNSGLKEEHCKICVCSVEGKDEQCSGRPARNVNECIRLANIMELFKMNIPYDHERGLSYRIRRDYIWHNDEIPYNAKAKCKRGFSYYSNNLRANDTDIDVATDVESLLDYSSSDVCFQCICSVDGERVDCISRDVWFCNYYKYIKDPDTPRNRYKQLFQQDRPEYFRQLSWRLRRTMDSGIYDFVETVGTNSKTDKCIPFVSEYSDCTEENLCTGCKKCLCVANGEWSCTPVTQCPNDFDLSFVDEYSVDEAINNIESEIAEQKRFANLNSNILVPAPLKKSDDTLLDDGDFDEKFRYVDVDAEIVKIMGRKKRSLNESTEGIKFYHTIDEINEDTLKNDSTSGTLQAKKFSNLSKLSRRTGLLSGDVAANNNSLHIEFNEPKPYDSHITDNKIDTVVHGEDSVNNAEKERINAILGNQTQKYKDKEISKIVVNELKKGTEFIGDKSATIMSNITFTPENDTLTAMAFIAGNLLNQLWNMEKDSSEESKETENLKHEKISDLLELFKEPLNLRQENFLKNALEHLSEAIDKDKVLKNISLCDKIEETKSILKDLSESSENASDKNNATKCLDRNNESLSKQDSAKQNQATNDAISKINNVLSLITKYQEVHNTLNGLKQVTVDSVKVPKRKSKSKIVLTDDESDSLNVFGKILEKITKLLVPPKKGKKIVKSIRNHNILRKSDDVTNKLKNIYGVDINNSTFSAKDKIVLDYLNTVKQNPHCVLENLKDMNIPFSGVEGDILLNLSQFFKIKSFVDLLKLLEAEKQKAIRIDDVTTQLPKVTSSINLSIPTETSSNLSKAKAKLKAHLKSIIDDLNELQVAKGIPARNFSLADTLPCIYNILNTDKNIQPDLLVNNPSLPVDKISDIFKTLKEELMSPQTRRFGVTIEPRPKSAIVWERIVKNYKGKNTQRTRRIMDYKDAIISFVDLKKKMDLIESTSKTYKSNVILKGLPPNKRLVLLKSLHEEVKRYIDVLEDIKNSFDDFKELSVEQQNDVNDFMYNAANNINLNDRVAKHLNKTKSDNNNREDVEFLDIHSGKKTADRQIQKLLRMSDVRPSNVRNNMMLSRDDIINQLIRNRMQIYIRAKESKGSDHNNDTNYNIAKKILIYLQKGDYNLARELYKYIVNQKKFGDLTRDSSLESYSSNASMKQSKGFKEPLIQFEEPKSQMEWNNHDLWRRRMMNLKKM